MGSSSLELLLRSPFRSVKKIISGILRSAVGRNALSLYGFQFANYLMPLIVVPYLVRVLGPEKFGAVAFGQGLMAYFTLVVNYGFDWSATRTISIERRDPNAVSRIASSVWIAKTLLCLGSFLFMMVMIQIAPRLQDEATLLYLLFGIVVGNVLFPTWLFQGLERMVAISVINFTMRALTTLAIFWLVRQPADFLTYAGLLSFQWVGAGALGIWVANRRFRTSFEWPGWQSVIAALSDGWMLFLSNVGATVSLYTTGNTFILGMLANNTAVGYYGAAEKLINSAGRLLGPAAQALYPRSAMLATGSKARFLSWTRKTLALMGGAGFVISFILFCGAPYIVRVVLGQSYEPSVAIVRILSAYPFINGITNILGVQIMLPLHRDKPFFVILLLAVILNVVLAIFLVPLWNEIGMAIAVLTAGVFVATAQLMYLRNYLFAMR